MNFLIIREKLSITGIGMIFLDQVTSIDFLAWGFRYSDRDLSSENKETFSSENSCSRQPLYKIKNTDSCNL